jgi:hypothetical protein
MVAEAEIRNGVKSRTERKSNAMVRNLPARERRIGLRERCGSIRYTSAPARVGGASMTFVPGVLTACHTHSLGMMLIITAGVGRVQREGWFPNFAPHESFPFRAAALRFRTHSNFNRQNHLWAS